LFTTGLVMASDPGQPLRGEDFVMLTPGLTAESVFAPYTCPTDPYSWCWVTNDGATFDSVGNQYGLRVETIPLSCTPPGQAYRWTVTRLTPSGVSENLAYIQTRCVLPQGPFDASELRGIRVDLANGWLYVVMYVYAPGNYNNFYDLVRIKGLPPLADVIQSYKPQSSSFTYTVPRRPEGMLGVDHFDTFWGPLAQPFRFADAQPLQCGYPSLPPQPGDSLSVADTVPIPPVGEGVYYITAATYQGERRFGRQYTNGAFSGRNSSAFPVCR